MRLITALRRRRLWRIPVALWVAGALLLAGGGTAYAYLAASGSGTGSSTSGHITNLTVAASTPTTGIFPGQTGTLYFKVHNPNGFKMTLETVRLATTNPITSHSASCPNANLTKVPAATPYTLPTKIIVPAHTSGTTTYSLPGFVKLSTTAPTPCQGVTFTVNLVFGARTS